MPDPFGWLAKNVAGPIQQALTGEVPGFLARPLAGTEKQFVMPGGSTGRASLAGGVPVEAGGLGSFQEDYYPLADEARSRLLRSYESGGANREAWISNALLSNPGLPRGVVEESYSTHIFPQVEERLMTPAVPHQEAFWPGKPSSVPGYHSSGKRIIAESGGPDRGLQGGLMQHEYAHAGALGSAFPYNELRDGGEAAEDGWREEYERWHRRRADVGEALAGPEPVRPGAAGWTEGFSKDVRSLDDELYRELFGDPGEQRVIGDTSRATHAGLRAEQKGNIHTLRSLLQEERGSGTVLPRDVKELIEGGRPAGKDYGGVNDLQWMLENRLKVSPERAAEILNLISSRTPQARGAYETALTGSPGSLSSALGRKWA